MYEIKNKILKIDPFEINLENKKRQDVYTIRKESDLGYFTIPIFLFLFWLFPACIFFIPMMITLFLYESFSYNFLEIRLDEYWVYEYKKRDWHLLKTDIDRILKEK